MQSLMSASDAPVGATNGRVESDTLIFGRFLQCRYV